MSIHSSRLRAATTNRTQLGPSVLAGSRIEGRAASTVVAILVPANDGVDPPSGGSQVAYPSQRIRVWDSAASHTVKTILGTLEDPANCSDHAVAGVEQGGRPRTLHGEQVDEKHITPPS